MDISKNISSNTNNFTKWEKIKIFFLSIFAKFLGSFQRNTIELLGEILGWIFWYTLLSRKKFAIKAIQEHLGYDKDTSTKIARQSFVENSISFLNIFKIKDFVTSELVQKIITIENYNLLCKEESPIVITAGHIGAWELMAALEYNTKKQRVAVVRNYKFKAINAVTQRLRSLKGMDMVGHRQASKVVLPILKKKGIAAFLVDHNTSRREAIFLPFLGKEAAVNCGPAMLALRSKAVVYPMFLIRKPKKGYVWHIYPPLQTKDLSGTVGKKIEIIAKYYTDCVADIVKKHPEQWFWMHNRWKTRPELEELKLNISPKLPSL